MTNQPGERVNHVVLPEYLDGPRLKTVIVVGGITVVFNTKNKDGCPTVEIYTPEEGGLSRVRIFTPENGGVLAVGNRMDNGTIFAGISPTTARPMYTRPCDERPCTPEEAMVHASRFDGHGKSAGDWRVPSEAELKILFAHHAKIDGLQNGKYYQSSGRYYREARLAMFFGDGTTASSWGAPRVPQHLRLVCGD